MKKQTISIIALLLAALFAFTACGSKTSDSSTTEASTETKEDASETEASTDESSDASTEEETNASPEQEDIADATLAGDQTLNLILGVNVSTLDVNGTGWVQEQLITSHIYEGLFRVALDESGNENYELAGAESYDVSDDNLTYTFHLRENTWSDGVPVTAQDYVDSFVRDLTAENGFSNVANYNFIKNGQAYYNGEAAAEDLGVKAIDDLTFELTFEYPDFDAIGKIAAVAYPIRQDVIDKATNEYGTDVSEIVYNGPFVASEWVTDNKLVLTKNPNYWDADNVTLETVNFLSVPETGTQATLFESQQLDQVEYNDDYADSWNAKAEAGEIVAIVSPRAGVRSLIFNQNGRSGLTKNAKVREAISLAIDRQEYIDTVFGRYTPAWNFTPYAVTVDGLEFNSKDDGTIKQLQAEYDTPEKLQELLKEGLDELGYEYNELSDVVLYFTDKAANTQDQARIEYLKQTWEAKLGITVETEVTADFSYMSGDYDVTNFTWNATSPYGALKIYESTVGNPTLSGNFQDDEVQSWFDEAVGVTDPEEVVRIYKQIDDKITGEAFTGPIYWMDNRYFQQSYVKNIVYRSLSANFDFTHAYIAAH